MKKFSAFTTEEIVVSLSLIAVLLIMMICLNNISGNNYKAALEKFSQVDSVLNNWAAQTLHSKKAITNRDVLNISLESFIKENSKFKHCKLIRNTDRNYDEIKLNNNITLQINFVKNQKSNGDFLLPIYNIDKYNMNEPNVAIIKVIVNSGHKNFSEDYVLKQTYFSSLANLYENWKKYPIEELIASDGKTIKVYCDVENTNNYPKEDICTKTEANGEFIYVKTLYTMPCSKNYTGVIEKDLIGSQDGVVEVSIDKCCSEPKIYIGGTKKCACPDKVKLIAGYYYNNNSLICQTPCLKGTYLKNGKCKPCDKNHYCPEDAMTAPIKCPNKTCGGKDGAVLQSEGCPACN